MVSTPTPACFATRPMVRCALALSMPGSMNPVVWYGVKVPSGISLVRGDREVRSLGSSLLTPYVSPGFMLPTGSRTAAMRGEGGEGGPAETRGPMKQRASISAALGAIVSSLASLSCCLPLGFAAALGAGAASAFLTTLRPWLLGLS